MNDAVIGTLIGTVFGGVISFGALYFQYEKISKPTLENEKARIALDKERFQNETLKLVNDIESLKLSIRQFEVTERDKNLNLLLDNIFQPQIKINNCRREEGFKIKKEDVIKISCNVTNEGKYSVIASDVTKSTNVKKVSFYKSQQSKFIGGSKFDVVFYVQFKNNDSRGEARIQFNTDPELVKEIQGLYKSSTAKRIRTSILNIVTF